MTAAEFLKQGKLDESLKALEAEVRKAPADPKLRVFLFQLLSVMGVWDRAANQLEVVSEMDPGALLMAQMCRQAILCEHFRAEVFAGKRSPLLLGEPDAWVQQMIAAMSLEGQGNHEGAATLRAEALEAAPVSAGFIQVERAGHTLEPVAFEWIADADPRLGPMLEVVVGGKYYWVPWYRIRAIKAEKPQDLRDAVWAPVQLLWSTGAATVGLIPCRYAGSESQSQPGSVRLGRETLWVTSAGGEDRPLGHRLFATESGEFSLHEVRSIQIGDGQAEWPSDRDEAMSAEAISKLPDAVKARLGHLSGGGKIG